MFLRWVQTVAQTAEPEVIALDGKTIRRSGDTYTGTRPLHLVSAWGTAQRLVLAQEAVETKDNEITALPEALPGHRARLTGLAAWHCRGAGSTMSPRCRRRGIALDAGPNVPVPLTR